MFFGDSLALIEDKAIFGDKVLTCTGNIHLLSRDEAGCFLETGHLSDRVHFGD